MNVIGELSPSAISRNELGFPETAAGISSKHFVCSEGLDELYPIEVGHV